MLTEGKMVQKRAKAKPKIKCDHAKVPDGMHWSQYDKHMRRTHKLIACWVCGKEKSVWVRKQTSK